MFVVSGQASGVKKAPLYWPGERGSKKATIAEAAALLHEGVTSIPGRPAGPIRQPLENSPQKRQSQAVREQEVKLTSSARQLEGSSKSAIERWRAKLAGINAKGARIHNTTQSIQPLTHKTLQRRDIMQRNKDKLGRHRFLRRVSCAIPLQNHLLSITPIVGLSTVSQISIKAR